MRPIYALCLIVLFAVTSFAQKLDEREAKKLVEEYVAASTTEARRSDIVARLKSGSPALSNKALKSALSNDAKRPFALDCAIAVKVPGLFNDAKKHVDTVDEEKVVRLGFVTGDKGAVDFLFERWKTAAVDSSSLAHVQAGFETFPVDLKTIQRFKPELKGDRKEDAAKIVRFQFGTESAEPATLLADWEKIEAAYKTDGREFVLKGRDLATLPSFASTGAVPIGRNYRLDGQDSISVPLGDEFNTGDFTVIVRVRAGEGELQRVGLYVGNGVWLAVHREGEFSITAGNATRFTADYKRGEWIEIRFEIKDESTDNAKTVRRADVYVGTKKLIAGGQTNGQVKKVEIQAHGGSLVVGGAEIIR